MSLQRIKIERFKFIRHCDISINDLNLLIGENGSGKTNVLDAIENEYKKAIHKMRKHLADKLI